MVVEEEIVKVEAAHLIKEVFLKTSERICELDDITRALLQNVSDEQANLFGLNALATLKLQLSSLDGLSEGLSHDEGITFLSTDREA